MRVCLFNYPSKTNIMKTIGPLFLDELRAQANNADEVPEPESANEHSATPSNDSVERIDAEIERANNQLETLRGEYDQAKQQVEQLDQQRMTHERERSLAWCICDPR